MALYKEKTLDNGVMVNYHRIVSLNIITNHANIIEVAGYTSAEKRKEEIDAYETMEPMNVYIETTFIEVPYDQGMTIDKAYEYLKAKPEFANSLDV